MTRGVEGTFSPAGLYWQMNLSRLLSMVWLVAASSMTASLALANDTPKISPGMTADEIRQRWGEPRSVKPMESPEGPAEIWTYTRLVARRTEPIATQVVQLPTFSPGLPNGLGTERQLTYELQTTWVHQDMQLLIYDGRMVSWKQNFRGRRSLMR